MDRLDPRYEDASQTDNTSSIHIFFRSLFQNHEHDVALIDDSGTIIAVNRSWASCSDRVSRKALCMCKLGDNCFDSAANMADHDSRSAFINLQTAVDRVLRKKHDNASFEYASLIDDTEHWFDVTVSKIGPPFTGALVMHVEITPQKELARQAKEASELLMKHNRSLETKVEEHAKRSRINEQLMIQQSKMTSINDMIASISHQWMGPISAISIIVQNLRVKYVTKDLTEDAIDETIKQVLSQVRLMTNTLDNFRNFFKTSVKDESFDLVGSIVEVLGIFHVQLLRHNIIVNVRTGQSADSPTTVFDNVTVDGASRPRIHGYPSEFKQVLLNILSNSRDAVAHLRKTRALLPLVPGIIDIELIEDEHYVVMHITDNGGGIPKDILDMVFKPYFSTKQSVGATGIGLYLAKAIIENSMKGTISAGNSGEGARITMRLVKGI